MEKEAIEIRKEINLLGPRGKTERIPDGIREKVYKYLQRKRKQGTSWEKIARKVGLGATTVHRLYDMYEKEPGQGEIVRVEVKTGQEI